MTKKLIPVFLLLVLCFTAMFSCKKTSTKSTGDATVNYFPVKIGKFVTYHVDSILYDDISCLKLETRKQIKYVISDTFRDSKKRLSYIMDEYSRPHEGSSWMKVKVILLTPAPIAQATTTPPPNTPNNSILYSQDGVQYVKVVFPITEGVTWKGNALVNLDDPNFAYLKNWNYTYQNLGKGFNTGYADFPNTVTVLENNESVNYPNLDSASDA
jgi:hypothetical protein